MFVNKTFVKYTIFGIYVCIWYLCIAQTDADLLTSELTSLTDLHHRVRDQSQPPI